MNSSRELCQRLGIRHPIVQAPMANVTTPELVAAVAEAGALGSIGAPYFTAAEITQAAVDVRARTDRPFAINLFIPLPPPPVDPARDAAARAVLEPFRAELGIPAPTPAKSASDGFDAQFEAVLRAKPAVFSFTMGVLDRDRLRALHAYGAFVIGTATTADEAVALEESGVDAVSAQGSEAGGHRGSFLGPTHEALIGLITLVPQIKRRVRIPVLAAGGIMDGRGIAAALALGAQGVQLGTAFLTSTEAGTSAPHRAALLDADRARRTVVSAAFSGRQGRAIQNRYTDAFDGIAVPGFPGFSQETRDVRAAASRQGRTDLMQLWAGQGAPLARALPARELIETLVRELAEVEATGASTTR